MNDRAGPFGTGDGLVGYAGMVLFWASLIVGIPARRPPVLRSFPQLHLSDTGTDFIT